MNEKNRIKNILSNHFGNKHIEAAFNHYLALIEKFQEGEWEQSLLKSGKFVEAILKSIAVYCRQPLPSPKDFKVPRITLIIEQQKATLDDSLRLTIPRACIFIYEIASNRGARHDPQEIDPNKMDATIATSVSSWIIAELVRFAEKGKFSPDIAADLVESLIEKQFPYFEDIDGRVYVNLEKLSAPDIGLLILYRIYPKRMSRNELIKQISRHGQKEATARKAVERIGKYFDDLNGELKIRGIGRQKARLLLIQQRRKRK